MPTVSEPSDSDRMNPPASETVAAAWEATMSRVDAETPEGRAFIEGAAFGRRIEAAIRC